MAGTPKRSAHRPRAVVPDPDGDAEVVEDLADVVRVQVTECEGDRGAAVVRRRPGR